MLKSSHMELKTFIALFLGKIIRFLTRTLAAGGGTAVPGLTALTIDKEFIANLVLKNGIESIVITGTNGKTTTSRMLSEIFSKAKIKTIHNRAGSNLLRGIASALIEEANLAGKIGSKLAIWETDEAVAPFAVGLTNPKILVISNLFRDQLDRYGEIDKLRKVWAETVKNLDKNQILVLNSDDPQIAFLGGQTVAKVFYFGLLGQTISSYNLPPAADARFCPNCSTPLNYKAVYVYHMGEYHCLKCNLTKPKPKVFAANIEKIQAESVRFRLVTPQGQTNIKLLVGGLYNIYNATAAATAAVAFGIEPAAIAGGLLSFRAAFGRVERFKINSKSVSIYLVKNPAGFNEVIKTLFSEKVKKDILIAINDQIADGRDVSWIWDVDLDPMIGKTNKVFVTGRRAADLALRLKYAGIDNFELIENDIGKTLKFAIKNSGKNLYLLPTYTAMLELRKIINKAGYGVKFWED